MAETHAEALPTAGADDDQAASPGPIATGPTSPTQFRRAARRPLPTAIKQVEDMMPRDLFIAGVMGGGYLLPSNYPSLAVVNRSFNDTMCQPRVILFRGMTAWTSGAKAEAKKWYEIATERFPCREALICLGMLTSDNDDLERAESLLRAAIAAEESPKETYLMFDPPEFALDLARVTLARVLQMRGAGTLERVALLRDVLSHEPVLATRDDIQNFVPDRTASVLLAEMIINEETPGGGTPATALALLEAVPKGDGRAPDVDGSVEFLLGMCHKKLAAAPDDEHARRAFQHMQRAMKLPSRHTYDAVYEVAVMTEEPTHAAVMFLTGCKADHARCTERVRELIAADPPDEELIQTLWAMQATGQLTDEVRSRNPTLAAAWALAEANPPPQQFQAMMAALAAQHLNAAAAGAEEAA